MSSVFFKYLIHLYVYICDGGDGVEAGAVRGCWCGSVPVPGGVWRGGQLQRRTSQPSVDSGQQTIAHRHTHTLVTS